MTMLVALLAWLAALAVFALAAILFVETMASLLPPRRYQAEEVAGPVAVIVPAHNEGAHIIDTLGDLRSQLRDGDRMLVVADNCTDDTAEIAASCGAEVIVRHDPARRGKGFALQFALDHLRDAPPACVAFFDADCRIAPGALHALTAIAERSGRPAQALYLMTAPETSGPRGAVAAFAWIMINRVRMTGLSNLADVTRFTGAGMAAPWPVVSALDFGTDDITEDLVMTFKMSAMKAPPVLAANALVTSLLPEADKASVTQRARWEHGSLGVLLSIAPQTLIRAIMKGDLRLAMLALDAMLPPMVMFAGLLIGAAAITFAAGFVAGFGPFFLAFAANILFALAVFAGWARFGRDALPVSAISGMVPFLFEKLKIYGRDGRRSSKTWTRTERGE